MEFERRLFVEQLKNWKLSPHRKPLIVRGARQVGKTYIVKKFAATHFKRTHYVNFEQNKRARELFAEDLAPKRILRDISFLLDTPIDPANDLVIFDEVQLAPQGITSLKYFYEDLPQCAICAAGSLIGLNLAGDSFPVGKVDMLTLYPMTFEEFLEALGNKLLLEYIHEHPTKRIISEAAHKKLFDYLTQYFVCGGMPAVVKMFAEYQDDLYQATKVVREQQLVLIDTYLSDFAKHCGKANALHIERVFRAVPSQMAGSPDSKAPRFQFKDVVPGISQYAPLASALDWLGRAGLILRVPILDKPIPPLAPRVKESRFKLYLHDVGLLGALADVKVEGILKFNFSNFKGYFAENFVAQELMACNARSLYCWKEGGAEVEFVLDRGSYGLPIEVKSGNFKQAKSLRVYLERYNPKEAIMLTGYAAATTPIAGVKVYPLYLAGRFAGYPP